MFEHLIQKFKDSLIKIYEWVQRKWLIVSFIISSSSIWFSLILNFFGIKFKLVYVNNNNVKFTLLGEILTFGIIGFSFLITLSQKYYEYDKLKSDKEKRKLFVLEHVDTDINKICDNKYMTLKKKIWKIKNEKIEEIPQIISSPTEQLKHIIEKMNNCLCKLLSQQNEYIIKQEELYISLYYNFPLENDSWQQTDRFSPERGLGIKSLLTKKTLFAKILKSRENFLFYNSKEQAKIEGCYIQDEEDKINDEGKIKGSIACYRIVVKECEQILVQAILSISTYDKQFINKDDKKTIKYSIYNIDEYILKPFIKRINIELCLLYLYDLHEKKN